MSVVVLMSLDSYSRVSNSGTATAMALSMSDYGVVPWTMALAQYLVILEKVFQYGFVEDIHFFVLRSSRHVLSICINLVLKGST